MVDADVSLFFDLNSLSCGGERGLLGLAFSPTYADDGEFYVYYSTAGDHRSRVSRFVVDPDDPDATDPTVDETVIFEVEPRGDRMENRDQAPDDSKAIHQEPSAYAKAT